MSKTATEMPDEVWLIEDHTESRSIIDNEIIRVRGVAAGTQSTPRGFTLYRRTDAPLPDDVRAAVERLRPIVDDPGFHRYAKALPIIPDLRLILTHLQEKHDG